MNICIPCRAYSGGPEAGPPAPNSRGAPKGMDPKWQGPLEEIPSVPTGICSPVEARSDSPLLDTKVTLAAYLWPQGTPDQTWGPFLVFTDASS